MYRFFMAIHCPSVGTRFIASVGRGGAARLPSRDPSFSVLTCSQNWPSVPVNASP